MCPLSSVPMSTIKEPKDFTCLMLVGFKIISSRFILLILSKSLRKAFLKCSFSLQFKKKWFVNAEVFSYIVPFQLPESGHLV